MSDMAERLISPISTAELERRWRAVRAARRALISRTAWRCKPR